MKGSNVEVPTVVITPRYMGAIAAARPASAAPKSRAPARRASAIVTHTVAAAASAESVARRARLALARGGAVLQVETTSYCNFRCRYCATHSEDSTLTLARGHMSVEKFGELVARHPRAALVIIQGDGEPLMDPTL